MKPLPLLLLAMAAIAASASAAGPAYNPGYSYPDTDPVYTFNYDVYNSGDGYQHQAFRQQEDRNGYETHGEYSVELPDGRIQRVVYQVTGDSGFIADVSYEGVAQPYNPPPHKKPAPYRPAPPPPPPPPPPPLPPKPAYVPARKPPAVYHPRPLVTYRPAPAYRPAKPVVYRPPPPPPPKPVVPAYVPAAPHPAPVPVSKRTYGPVRFNPFG